MLNSFVVARIIGGNERVNTLKTIAAWIAHNPFTATQLVILFGLILVLPWWVSVCGAATGAALGYLAALLYVPKSDDTEDR